MIMLNETMAVVFNTDDLRDAVSSDNGVEYVYFGADITLAYGITIYPNKPSLIFDGTYEGVTRTFTDMNYSTTGNTIGIRSVSNITITFQNINLIGRNFYGIPYVPNSSSYAGVSTIYHNVTYTGTQIVHNPYGFASFTDCNITVNNNEVAEVNRLEINGTTTIVKTNDGNSVFWFYGNSARRPYLKILSDANVTITTANYFMFESQPPDYIIEPGASFTLNTNSGISLGSGHTVASFLVGENASFIYKQTSGGSATIYLDGALMVNEGASFYMQADFANTNQLIWFTGSAGGLYINNPKSFALYNRGNSSAMAFRFSSQIPFVFTGGQLNDWESARTFPTAGAFDDIPLHKWNRPNWEQFTLRGTANTSNTNVTFNDFTPEELDELPDLEDLHLYNARVFSIGNLPLEIYSTVVTRRVTGTTEPYANVRLVYLPTAFEDPQTVIASVDGLFAITPTEPVPYSDYIEVFSNTPFLIVSVIRAVRAEEELYIEEAPVQIKFLIQPMQGFSGVILPRDNTDSLVVVVDTRNSKTEWQLWARITEPLKTEDNDVLDDAVVFVLQNGGMATLGDEYIPVHTDGPYVQDGADVKWDEDKGVLARITTPMRSGKRYSTQLGWVVTPIGVEPEVEN